MKTLILITLMTISSFAFSAEVCNLQANDQAVAEINETFDNGEMRGEDHAIGLKLLYTERLLKIAECISSDKLGNITKQELKDAAEEVQYQLDVYVTEMNEAIQNSIEHDRIGMAMELTRERDLHVVDVKNLLAKIKRLL